MNIKRIIFQMLDEGKSLADCIARFSNRTSEHYIRGIYGQYNRTPVCPHCHKHITQYHHTRRQSEELAIEWHSDCWSEVYVRCSGCNTQSLIADNRLEQIPNHGRYCATCASERFAACAECGDATWNDDLYMFNGQRCNSRQD
jgi:hypothetical protein